MTRVIVGVLRGGTSSEYDLSLKTGSAMHAALPEDRYEVRDILIDKSGMWHSRGTPSTPARALAQVDVVLNALHGGVGEDGTVHRILEQLGIPYAGSRAAASSNTLHKVRMRRKLLEAGIRMPQAVAFSLSKALTTGDMAEAVFGRFGPPYVVKPVSEGAGAGIVVARTIAELPDALGDVIDAYGSALVEEFIRGEEVSVGVIHGFRDEEDYVLPPAHVEKAEDILRPQHHVEGSLRHIVPSPFSHGQKLTLMDVARLAHRALELEHFSRSDMIVTPSVVYLFEVNATPGLYPGASFPPMLESVGSSVTEFLEHAIHLARTR
jgi:D-alanine-D-alanine ligase